MKILHVITSLNQGGAEGALVRLIKNANDPSNHSVISLMDLGLYGPKLSDFGVKVYSMNQRSEYFSPIAFMRMRQIIKDISPDVIQTWMYHSDLLGGLAAKSLGIPVAWGLRHTNNSIHDLGFKTWIVAKVCALISYFIPYCIVGCSQRAIALHLKFGYADRFVYIPNGFNISDSNALIANAFVRSPPVFGHAARLHTIKGHADFLSALNILRLENLDFRARMAGTNVLISIPEFFGMVPASVAEHIEAIGPQSDMPGFYKACDVFVLSSHGEAFPNVVAEAMLAGLPCIVTDVGDAAEIVGDTGWVVPAKDPQALAVAMHQAMVAMADTHAWAARKAAACARITNLYSMDKMQSRFEAAWTAAMEN